MRRIPGTKKGTVGEQSIKLYTGGTVLKSMEVESKVWDWLEKKSKTVTVEHIVCRICKLVPIYSK